MARIEPGWLLSSAAFDDRVEVRRRAIDWPGARASSREAPTWPGPPRDGLDGAGRGLNVVSRVLKGALAKSEGLGARRPPNPKPLDVDSTGEGLSPCGHTPISAPRSETRS